MELQNGSEIEIRKEKITALKEDGQIVYKEKFETSGNIEDVLILHEKGLLVIEGQPNASVVTIAGRMIGRRIMGKFGFFQLYDITGKLQVSVGRNEFSEEDYEFYKKRMDIGDFVGVSGTFYITQTGELTLRASKLTLLSKSIRPLPEKFHGLVDIDARYRQRYLDLIANEDSRRALLGRLKLTQYAREFLQRNGFVEVETPILQTIVSGATAKPFFTKHNALDLKCNLRIAPECYLKELVAGGFNRVFEVAKCFRNEGMDAQHLQEFTQIEWYAAYWNFEDNIRFYQEFIREILTKLFGEPKFTYQGVELDFGKEWERIDYVAAMQKVFGFDFLDETDADKLIKKIVEKGLFKEEDFYGIKTVGGVIDFVYKRKIRVNIVQPTIIYNYPATLAPLARRSDKDQRIVDKFQVGVCGTELCNAYSELVDPYVQRKTLEEQAKARLAGDDEAMELDEGFLLSMEHGMPPISGLGTGIDRLSTIFFDQPSIRDVVLFPLMKG